VTDFINVYQHRKDPLIEEGVIRHHRADAEMELAESNRDWLYLYTVEKDGGSAKVHDLSEAAEEIRLEQAAGGYLSEAEHDRAYGGRR